MFKNFDIAVDTTKGIRNQAISVNTNDLQTLQFSFTITQSGVPVNLTGATVRLAVKKPDKNTVFQDCTITDATAGKCQIILDTQAYIVPGLHPVELMVYYAADKVSVTGRFSYTANQGILNDSSIVSTNEFQAITQTLTDVENIVVDLRNNGTGIDAQARSDLETVNTQLADTAKKVDVGEISQLPTLDKTSIINAMKEHSGEIKSQFLNVKYPSVSSGLAAWSSTKTDAQNTTALQAIINYASTNNMIVFLPPGTYRTTAPLVIPTKQGFEMKGAGNRYTHIDPQHSGNVIEIIGGQSHVIRDIKIHATDALYKDKFTGIYVKDSLLLTFDNIHIFYPKNGVVYEGSIYVCDFSNLYVYYFKEKGIYFKKFGTGSGSAPNGNNFDIKFIRGQGKDVPNSYGIYLEAGSVNTFSHGQVSDCDTAIYQAEGYRNYYEKFWLEICYTTIEILSGNAYVDCHGAFLNKVSTGASLFNYNGQSTPYLDLTRDQPKEDKNLKAMWFFNEGSGSRVLDKSGNKKHITLAGTPTWTTDGTWGTAAYYKYSDGRTIPIPLNTVDWSQPFTYMINYSVEAITGDFPPAMGLYLFDSVTGNYFAAGHTKASLIALSYMGGVLENPAAKATGRSGQKLTGRNIYEFVYVDPINKTVEALDPFANSNGVIQMANSFTIPNPTLAVISGRNHVSNTAEGNISMAGFWQRKLSINEVYDIVNNNDRPFKQFDKKIQLSTVLVSPNGSDYKITVNDSGVLTTTLI